MIPYDDLVNALAAWRARQGLPVAQAAGAPAAPPPRAPAPPPQAARKSAQQPAARTAPPSAPPRAAAPPQAPRAVNDFDEGEGAMVEEAAYDGGDDFVVPFGSAGVETGEATAIGEAPEAPANVRKRNPDW